MPNSSRIYATPRITLYTNAWAHAISFKQLAENHPDAELEIVAMEKRGQDKFLLRAKTAATADKSELSAEYFDTYNALRATLICSLGSRAKRLRYSRLNPLSAYDAPILTADFTPREDNHPRANA